MLKSATLYIDAKKPEFASGVLQWSNYLVKELTAKAGVKATVGQGGGLIFPFGDTTTHVSVGRMGDQNLLAFIKITSVKTGTNQPYSLSVVGLLILRMFVHLIPGRANIGKLSLFGLTLENVGPDGKITEERFEIGPVGTRAAYAWLVAQIPNEFITPYVDGLKCTAELLPARK